MGKTKSSSLLERKDCTDVHYDYDDRDVGIKLLVKHELEGLQGHLYSGSTSASLDESLSEKEVKKGKGRTTRIRRLVTKDPSRGII